MIVTCLSRLHVISSSSFLASHIIGHFVFITTELMGLGPSCISNPIHIALVLCKEPVNILQLKPFRLREEEIDDGYPAR